MEDECRAMELSNAKYPHKPSLASLRAQLWCSSPMTTAPGVFLGRNGAFQPLIRDTRANSSVLVLPKTARLPVSRRLRPQTSFSGRLAQAMYSVGQDELASIVHLAAHVLPLDPSDCSRIQSHAFRN